MLLDEKIINQLQNVNDDEVSLILRKIKFSVRDKSSVVIRFDELELLWNYILNLQFYSIVLNDELDDLKEKYNKLDLFCYFLEGHNKTLRNDKARSDKKGV